MEAQHAESKADFIHKFRMAAKEAEETGYWLLLCQLSKNYPNCEALIEKANELGNIIGRIISTGRRKIK